MSQELNSPPRAAATRQAFHCIPTDRLTRFEGWAMLARSMGYLYRPSTLEDVRAVVRLAQSSGRPLVPRGSGYSHGDTALNAENIVLDLSRMTCVLGWDPADSPV